MTKLYLMRKNEREKEKEKKKARAAIRTQDLTHSLMLSLDGITLSRRVHRTPRPHGL